VKIPASGVLLPWTGYAADRFNQRKLTDITNA